MAGPNGKWGHPFLFAANWDIHFLRVKGSNPFPPPLRGSPRPSVSGHPGLAARATCRGRRRGRASESSDTTPWIVRMQRAASGGRGLRQDPAARSGRSPFTTANWDIHFLRVKGSNPFPPPRGSPRPSVSGHPGLAARATRRGRRRGRASESSDTTPWIVRMQRAASGGRGLRQDPAARSGRSPFTTANWDIHFLRVKGSNPFPPPLRGSPRPSVSGHPGLARLCHNHWPKKHHPVE